MEIQPAPKERVSIKFDIHQEDEQNSNWMLETLRDCWMYKTISLLKNMFNADFAATRGQIIYCIYTF